jgi:hypothetical protein
LALRRCPKIDPKIRTEDAMQTHHAAAPFAKPQNPQQPMELGALFTEMQALMALMPGMGRDDGRPLPSDEDVEAMFDNMPV